MVPKIFGLTLKERYCVLISQLFMAYSVNPVFFLRRME